MERDLRYLLVTTDFSPSVGGVQTLLSNLRDGLSGRADVAVVTLGDPPPAERERARNRDVVYVRRLPWKFATYVVFTIKTLARAVERDLLICGHVNAGPPVLAAHFLLGKPYVVYVHAMEVTDRRWMLMYRLILNRAKKIVVGSSFAGKLLVRFFGIDSAVVINPAVDRLMLGRAICGTRDGATYKRVKRKVLLTVGRLDAAEGYKGHDTVISAMPDVLSRSPGAEYWVVGDGTDRGRLEALTRQYGVADAVRFFGNVKDVVPFYRMCTVFVMVSDVVYEADVTKGEGFGLVYIEAALFGKPVIAADRGGAADAVIDGYTGFLIEPRRPDILAEKAVFLLNNPSYAKAMGRRGKAWVLSRFNPRRQLDEFESVLLKSL